MKHYFLQTPIEKVGVLLYWVETMTIKEIEKYAKSIGLCGEFGDPFIGCLYMSFGEPHKSTVLYYTGTKRKRKIYISKTLIWRKSNSGHIYFKSNDFPKDEKSHMMTEYPSYSLSDNNGITNALNNLGVAYKRCLVEIKKNCIEKDFSNDE